jgi:hypothetical protein
VALEQLRPRVHRAAPRLLDQQRVVGLRHVTTAWEEDALHSQSLRASGALTSMM